MNTNILCLLLACVVACAACGETTTNLADDNAEQALRAFYGEQSNRILLGSQRVSGNSNNFDEQRISTSEYKEVLAWQSAGLVTIDVERPEPLRVRVRATTLGRNEDDAARPRTRDSRFIYARLVDWQVESIVENVEFKTAIDRYRVIKGTIACSRTELGRKVLSAAQITTCEQVEKRNFIVVFKFDSFAKAWIFGESDYAKLGEEFATNDVATYVAAVQSGRPPPSSQPRREADSPSDKLVQNTVRQRIPGQCALGLGYTITTPISPSAPLARYLASLRTLKPLGPRFSGMRYRVVNSIGTLGDV